MRKNRHITDMKYNTKRRLESIKGKLESISAYWGDVDFFISSSLDQLLSQIDEIKDEIDGIDVSTH